MSRLPDELITVIDEAAMTVPPHQGDLDRVLRRHRLRHRRRAAAGAVATVAVVGLSAGAVPYVLGDRGAEPGPRATQAPAEQPPPATVPAQRLLLYGAGWSVQSTDGPEIGIATPAGLSEVLADGSLVTHPIPGVDSWYQADALPDGRIVVLGYRDLAPGKPREDGPGVTDLSIKLVVLRPDGTIERAREVRVIGEPVSLVAATDRVAYLLRPRGLVAHDISTGAERVVLGSATIGANPGPSRMDVAAGRLAVPSGSPSRPCSIRVTDLASTRPAADVSLASLGCEDPDGVRLSPDGRLVAVSYQRSAEIRLAVVDIASGTVRTDRSLRPPPGPTDRFAYKPSVYGMAWTDSANLRVAIAELPPRPDRVYPLAEVFRVVTISTAPGAAPPPRSPSR
jgi:hypothetical protein